MLAYALCILTVAQSGQWVQNPGFEQAVNDRPLRWELFVQPMDGAYGRVSSGEARSGERSAMLHIPRPYLRDPANNWNQTILGEFAGKTVEVSGYIKTDGATDAAIWLQCWQQPARLLQTTSSASITPIYGTADWRRVSFTADVPGQTDFLVIRCVLQGEGSAWFDDITLVAQGPPVAEVPADPLAMEEPPPLPPIGEGLSAAGAASVLEAALALQDAVQRLRESNEALQQRFNAIEAELDSLRGALVDAGTALPDQETPIVETDPSHEEGDEELAPRLPVLVPYGTISGRAL